MPRRRAISWTARRRSRSCVARLGRVPHRRGGDLAHRLHQLGLDLALQLGVLGVLEQALDRIGQIEGLVIDQHELLLDPEGVGGPGEPVLHGAIVSGAVGRKRGITRVHSVRRSNGTRLRRHALHPGFRPSRVVPEEDVRNRGRPHARGDRPDRGREAPDLRGHAQGHGAGPRAGHERGSGGRAVRRADRPAGAGQGARAAALDAGGEVGTERVRLPVRRRVRRAHRAVRPRRSRRCSCATTPRATPR